MIKEFIDLPPPKTDIDIATKMKQILAKVDADISLPCIHPSYQVVL